MAALSRDGFLLSISCLSSPYPVSSTRSSTTRPTPAIWNRETTASGTAASAPIPYLQSGYNQSSQDMEEMVTTLTHVISGGQQQSGQPNLAADGGGSENQVTPAISSSSSSGKKRRRGDGEEWRRGERGGLIGGHRGVGVGGGGEVAVAVMLFTSRGSNNMLQILLRTMGMGWVGGGGDGA